ncbi:MAG: hypothetical protein ACN6I4_01610 [bacterium]
MFHRYIILSVFLFLAKSIYAQNEKEFTQGKWEISGIEPSYTYLRTSFYPLQTQDFFKAMARSDIANQQYQSEIEASKVLNNSRFTDWYYPLQEAYSGYETSSNTHISSIDINFLIKKKQENPNWLLKNLAFKIGIGYNFNANYYALSGDSTSATHYYRYYSSSFLTYHVFKLNTGLQFQTPSVANFLSLYISIDGYVGGIIDFMGERYGTQILSEAKAAPYKDRLKRYDNGHRQFEKPILNLGISAPMGLALKFTKNVTFKMGVVYNYNSYLIPSRLVGMRFAGGRVALFVSPDE